MSLPGKAETGCLYLVKLRQDVKAILKTYGLLIYGDIDIIAD